MTSSQTHRPKTVAYVTGTRADFGLMTPVLSAIAGSTGLRLRVYATGMHLMPEYGNTVEQVERTFPGVARIPVIPSSTDRQGMAAFHGALTQELARTFTDERPDVVLVLGDRVEMHAVASACLYLGIPVAHIHGGDVSGTVDDMARHAITRLASLHFPATPDAATRIRRMAVDASRIHVVGAPGLDVILNEPLPSRAEVCNRLGISATQPFLLVTQHPVTETHERAGAEMQATLDAAASFDMPVIVIYPNTDAGSADMIKVIEARRNDARFRMIPSLSHPMFLALERDAAAWIGNSSAGVIESASFKTPVIDIGTRQQGRLCGANVIHVPHDRDAIRAAIHRALHDASFRASLRDVTNPWGDGKASLRIVRVLERGAFDGEPERISSLAQAGDRFATWRPPEIWENTPTKWQWMVRHVDGLQLGKRTDIGAFTYINAKHGVYIGDDVQIGAHCAIYSVSTIDDKQGAVRLEKGCRIGTHSTIMPGVTIGENALIGAHSFVTKDVPPNAVAYGIPARVVRAPEEDHADTTYPIAKPSIGEAEVHAVVNVLKSGTLSLGPVQRQFEKDFADTVGAKHAVAVSSGTAGLHLALIAAGIGPGDEVVTSPFSFIASANAILYVGATPVFVDVDPLTGNIDPSKIEQALTERTKAILPVHMFGQAADMTAIMRIAQRHRLKVVEDACESVCATHQGKMAGMFGDAAVFAFYPNKQMTTGEGGMIVTPHAEFAEQLRSLANQGRAPNMQWLDHRVLGYNYRMDEMSAALGLTQLHRLPSFIQKRQQIARWYDETLADVLGDRVEIPHIGPGNTHTYFVYVIRTAWRGSQRDALIAELARRGVQSKPYVPSIHLFSFYRERFGFRPGQFAISEDISDRSLALPFYVTLTKEDVRAIVSRLRDALAML